MTGERGPSRKARGAAKRLDHEPPPAIAQRGWRFHHIGIPTDVVRPGETHLEAYGLHVSGFSTSPYGVEWMRFDEGCSLHPLIRTVPHVAFEVDDLDAALEGQEVIYPSGSPSDGVRAAMILHDGAPIELICFRKRRETPRGASAGKSSLAKREGRKHPRRGRPPHRRSVTPSLP